MPYLPRCNPCPVRQNPDFEDSDYRGGQRYNQYRKKSWLDEIFD
jgi:Zn-finger nucleic acid-binding protein